MDLGLDGVHVLVTGASGGIGLETTKLYLKLGAKVSAQYRSNLQPLQPLQDKYGHGRIRNLSADLEQEDDVARIFQDANESFGPVQVVIINHGYWETADVPVSTMSLEQWNSTISTDLTSPFLVCREFLRQLELASDALKEKASIVLIGSTAGKYGEANHADYAACKSALMYGLTLSLKNEIVKIAPKGRVNSIAPGWVYTPMAEEALKDPAVVYRSLATTPMKKFAQPYDIAAQIAIVSSSTVSGHVTGQVIMVEGGMEGRLLNPPEELR
ncbi:NAD-P-binding protein [Panus rudis PR-1116 ss-1]|nr:NAD-P-binding protein [Panus rudis PR-1116 ss-1]